MKKFLTGSLAAFALIVALAPAARADEFSQLAADPHTYWVPAPTPPPPGYASAPYNYPPGYYPPPPRPGYYAPAGPPVRFFIGFHFH